MSKISGNIEQIDQWKSTMFLYNSALKSINTKIDILNSEFLQLYHTTPIEHVTSRLKSPQSIVKKLKKKNNRLTITYTVTFKTSAKRKKRRKKLLKITNKNNLL